MFFKKNGSALLKIESCIDMVSEESIKHVLAFGDVSKSLDKGWEENLEKKFSDIVLLNRARASLSEVIASNDISKQVESMDNKYQISSIFLIDCFKYLVSDSKHAERLNLVTGTITSEGTKVLSRLEKVDMELQSPVYVQAQRDDSHKKIVTLSEDFGHLLLGMFHCHTSTGTGSTQPSSTDIQNLKRKEKIGIDCIGGIFSIDGYVRFYSLKAFEIDVYGKGVQCIKQNQTEAVFKINIRR